MGNKFEIIVTEDGSNTLFVSDLDEYYHSVYGAVQESRYVYIDAGLKLIGGEFQHIQILEIGFGTGLNALLTLLEIKDSQLIVDYDSIEAYPLKEAIWSRLNYPDFFDDPLVSALFTKMHSTDWGQRIQLDKKFTLQKIHAKLEDMMVSESKYHLVYFDAFSPDVQPELWTTEIFRNIYGMMQTSGVLVTYSAKGAVRRAMESAGFKVERLPGPPGKREMLRGKKEC